MRACAAGGCVPGPEAAGGETVRGGQPAKRQNCNSLRKFRIDLFFEGCYFFIWGKMCCTRRAARCALWTARCATKRDFFLISYTGMLRREKFSRFRIPGCYEEKNFPDFVYRKCYEERNFPDFVYQTCYEMKRFCSLRSKACYENKNFFLFVAEHATKTKIFSSS